MPIFWYVPFRVRTSMGALDGSGDMRVSEGRGPDIGESNRVRCWYRDCPGRSMVRREGGGHISGTGTG